MKVETERQRDQFKISWNWRKGDKEKYEEEVRSQINYIELDRMALEKKAREYTHTPYNAANKVMNRLRINMKEHRQEWISCCHDVNDMIKEIRKRMWKKHVEEMDLGSNCTKTWKLIQALDGKTSGSKNHRKIMCHNNKERITDKSKANAFASHYAKLAL